MTTALREAELLDVRRVMETSGGRSFVWRFLQESGASTSTFDKDPYRHAYNAGSRDRGLWLEREIKDAAPGGYVKMVEEHVENG